MSMENQEKQLQKVDVFVFLGDFLRQVKRTWVLGLALIAAEIAVDKLILSKAAPVTAVQ